jgi:hypothetical protein
MLASDLAELYGVQTKVINQSVKRNIVRFPEIFAFKISNAELLSLRSQIVTLEENTLKNVGQHSKFGNLVFTEFGVAMLATVLRSKMAHEVTIEIVKTFVTLRKLIPFAAVSSERISSIESSLINQQNQINEIHSALKQMSLPKSGIFFNDQIFDAYVFSSELIAKAKKSVILIDNYIDETTLLQLSKRNTKVSCTIYTERITEQLKLDVEKHNAQYPSIEICILKNAHDRFLILDEKELYHLGASLKDLGKRWFAFSKMDSLVNQILLHLQ